MKVTFTQANNYSIAEGMLIAAWKVWFKRFSGNHQAWKYGKMPIFSSEMTLSDLIRADKRFTFEVLSRMMIPWSYRNSSQISSDFLQSIEHLLEKGKLTDFDGLEVDSLNLTDEALTLWDELSFAQQDGFMSHAEAIVQADIEVQSNDPIVLDDQGVELIGEDTYPPYIPAKEATDEEFVKALVAWIADAPYQAYYLKQPVGEAVAGWGERLSAFFWPKPRIDYSLYQASLNPLIYRVSELATTLDKGESWDQEWRDMAVKTSQELFLNSGTPQKEVTIEHVEAVIQAALSADPRSTAKINSGWSYLASLATAHLEGQAGRLPMVHWNSRVASSILSRLDFLLTEAGVTKLGERFENIGSVPGWGGTRPRQYTLDWPNGYRCWKSQIAASKLVNQMAKHLNSELQQDDSKRYAAMPLVNGGTGDWSVLGVQAVLFGDGY